MVGETGVLHGIRRVGVAEPALDGGDVAGLVDKVPAHGVPGIMRGVVPYPGQLTNLAPNPIDYPYVQPAVSVCAGGRRQKQRQRPPFLVSPPLSILLFRQLNTPMGGIPAQEAVPPFQKGIHLR